MFWLIPFSIQLIKIDLKNETLTFGGAVPKIPSAIKPVLATLEQALVIKVIGLLSARDAQAPKEVLATLIG